MVSIIVYAADAQYTAKTIDSILDCTKPSDITEIIVCDDIGLQFAHPAVKVITTNLLGRAKAWAKAVESASGEYLVFCKGRVKFSPDWLSPLLAAADSVTMASPVIYGLDLVGWSSEEPLLKRIGWRWDLSLKGCVGAGPTPTISSNCFIISRSRYSKIGGFDTGMQMGVGEDIELSLRNWLMGGICLCVEESVISAAHEVDNSQQSANNLARIAETWFGRFTSRFYAAIGIDRSAVDPGKLTNLLEFSAEPTKPMAWFISELQPELGAIFARKGTAAGLTVAVVCPGPSIDKISKVMLRNYDIVVGVDYAALLHDCNYVLTDSAPTAAELRSKYADGYFVLPVALFDGPASKWTNAHDVVPGSSLFELGHPGASPLSVDPPFCNFEFPTAMAIHFALFLNPTSVTVFGCDNKIIEGKSHTTRVEFYNDGEIWPDSEATRRRFEYYEFAMDKMGKLALGLKIPLLRVNHA